MKKYAASLLITSLLLPAVSCNKDQKALLPNPTGKPGEVLLVIDKAYWDSDLGEYFTDLMNRPFEVVPQYEPIYTLIHIPSPALNKIFKSHRNIIITKISSRYEQPKIIVQRNIWAKYQLLVNVAGPDTEQVLAYLKQHSDKLLEVLHQAELSRTMDNYKKNRAKGIAELLMERHKLTVSVPSGYTLDLDTTNFVWLGHQIADLIQGVMIYYYDYTDPQTFTPEYLIKKRNEFTKKFINGPVDNSYMVVEDQVPVITSEMSLDSTYVFEMRGLWKLENAFMGGPFISHTMLDEKRNRVITVDGFVHAPGLDKRNYVRELEAILYSLRAAD